MNVLSKIQQNAKSIVESGGLSANLNWLNYTALSRFITDNWVSPGGSADLLSATIFIKKITTYFKTN
jgi:triphosphoribosyl-dephospho-CoA synthase